MHRVKKKRLGLSTQNRCNGWINQPKIDIQNVFGRRVKIKFEKLNVGFVLSLIKSRF